MTAAGKKYGKKLRSFAADIDVEFHIKTKAVGGQLAGLKPACWSEASLLVRF